MLSIEKADTQENLMRLLLYQLIESQSQCAVAQFMQFTAINAAGNSRNRKVAIHCVQSTHFICLRCSYQG